MKHVKNMKLENYVEFLIFLMPNKWILYFPLYVLEMQTVMYEINLEASVSKGKL